MSIDMTVLKGLVADGKKAVFSHYKAGYLYYTVDNFEFPVPISDTGDGTFLAEERSILFMRYIRKHLKYLDDSRILENAIKE